LMEGKNGANTDNDEINDGFGHIDCENPYLL